MITRSEYMKDSKRLHDEYYLQFSNESTVKSVLCGIGWDEIKKSENPHFNDIPLQFWDALRFFIDTEKLKSAGESYTLSTKGCIAKATARKIRESVNLIKIKRDINGNPRYIFHFLEVNSDYEKAAELIKNIGAKKYRVRGFTDYFVIQSFNVDDSKNLIKGLRNAK